jgi:hypothetical protein
MNNICFNYGSVSRFHANIQKHANKFYVYDISNSGTWLDGKRLPTGSDVGFELRDGHVRTCHTPGYLSSAVSLRLPRPNSQELLFGCPPKMSLDGRVGVRAVVRLGATIERVPRITCRHVERSSCIHILAYDLLELRGEELRRKLALVHNPSQLAPEEMDPLSKRQRLNECVSIPAMPLVAEEPSIDVPPPANEPFGQEIIERLASFADPRTLLTMTRVCKSWHAVLMFDQQRFDERMSASIQHLGWAVWANDPVDRRGVETVFAADHVHGKGERMVKSAFPLLSGHQIAVFLQMPASNVFKEKKGGTKQESVDCTWSTISDVIEHVQQYGDSTTIWGCGGASDRAFAQCSMQPGADGFINPNNMRPLNGSEKPATWDGLGFRKTPGWEEQVSKKWGKKGFCKSINLFSTANGTGTYRAELWRGGQLVHVFMIGIYPHPGSQSWGDIQDREEHHKKFLRDLAFRTPSQTHVIRINADDFD